MGMIEASLIGQDPALGAAVAFVLVLLVGLYLVFHGH